MRTKIRFTCMLVMACVVSSVVVLAQSGAVKDDNLVPASLKSQPSFVGGEEALFRYLSKTVKYPAKAMQEGTEGRVMTGFVVEEDGSVTFPMVLWGVSKELDKESLRVVMNMPYWQPGISQEDKPVKVSYRLPINFALQRGQKQYERVYPEYPGGIKELRAYLTGQLQYPANVPEEQGKGKMAFVEFVVNKKGKIRQASVLAGTGSPALDAEALRLVNAMPDWTPGVIDGKTTFVRCAVPVYF